MTTLRMLLLSDFHQNMTGQKTLWPNTREKFFDDLTRLSRADGAWDFILFTGDLTQRGTAPEFKALGATLNGLWEHLRSLGSDPKLVVIPGNHDLMRPDATAGSVRGLAQWASDVEIQEHFWKNRTNEYRVMVDRAFEPFTKWRRSEARHVHVVDGCVPGDISATLGKGDAVIGIVGLNSAFLQLSGADYKGKLEVSYNQVLAVCGNDPPKWAKRHDVCLLLTHHPTNWLHQASQAAFSQELFDPTLFPVHLFGHMHGPEQRSSAVGGGATPP